MLPKDELAAMAEALVNLTSFKRKVSRIPKEIADIIGLKEGSDVKVAVKEKKIVIEPF